MPFVLPFKFRRRFNISTPEIVALYLQRTPAVRHAFFALCALVSIYLVGFHFGTFDQAIHFPFLKASADPTLFPGDRFISLRDDHYSFFWIPFFTMYRWGVLEMGVFIVHFFATYLTFHAIWELGMTLFEDALSALFCVLAFVAPHLAFLGFPIIEFSLLNRTFVLPFLLLAINLYLQGKPVRSFLLLGVMYNLHLLTTNFVFGMLFFASVMQWRKWGWRTLLAQLAVFITGALPVLYWKASRSGGLDWSIRPEWVSGVMHTIIYSIFNIFSTWPPVILFTTGGFCALAMFMVAQRESPSKHSQTLWYMVIAALLVMVVQIITTYWLPITFIIQLQISRISLFIVILAYLAFSHYLIQIWRKARVLEGRNVLLAGIFLISPTPILPFALWGLRTLLARWRIGLHAAITVLYLLLAGFLIGGLITRVYYPGIYITPEQTPWIKTQIWAKDNTPLDAVFITPPYEYGIYTSEWRVFSERSTVVTMAEILEVALLPDYFDTWKARLNAVVPGALEQYRGDFFKNQEITAAAYNGQSDAAFLQVACTYNASYLVIKQPYQRNLPLAYHNEGFSVYDLRSVKQCAK